MPDQTTRAYLRALRARGPVTDSERAELEHADNVYTDRWWMNANEIAWVTKLESVAQFFREQGRWPSRRAAAADERSLGEWLSRQR